MANSQDILWLGTDHGYMIKYSNSKLEKISFENNPIIDIAIDMDGNKWLLIQGIGCMIFNENRIVNVANKPINTIPKTIQLFQNYPNPFNPSTNIEYRMPITSIITLKVYDALGKLIKTLVNEVKNPGIYSVNFNAVGLPSGVYFYMINSGENTQTRKMILMKKNLLILVLFNK